ncbi:MAG: hypothetical protein CVV45_03090 [Spirochaetae bacterium HGW-Spirochaetae-10]|nr:MAG: hypothetical protein CVV45_03090 [Spirochaetae bacterium HGW-Spirochaetae-10]
MNTMFLEPARGRGGSFFDPQEKSILRKIRSVMEAFETISYICVLDRRARIVRMNDRFAALFGAESADSTGMSVIPYLKRAGLSRLTVQIWKTLHAQSTHRQELALAENGEAPKWFDIHVTPYHDQNGQIAGAVAVLLDITERKHVEEAMAFHAYHDALTGLPNRRRLEDRLHQTRLRADRLREKFALLFVDLDRFKQVNDVHGHRIGDAVLIEVASRIESVLRRDDTVCRQGGDEFIILLPGIRHPAAATGVARKLIDILSRPIFVDNTICRIGASVGIALYPDHDPRPDRLIQLADRAMYRAKASGRGRFAFFEDLPTQVALPIRIEERSEERSEERTETLKIPEACHQCLMRVAADAGLPSTSLALLAKS